MSEYTKGKWRARGCKNIPKTELCADGDDFWIIAEAYGDNSTEAAANALRIAKCVNLHDELVEALELVRDFRFIHHKMPESDTILMEKIEKAIAKARKEQ